MNALRAMRRSKPVLANLAISYVTIVVVIVLLLCSILYLVVPPNYEEQIRANNTMVMDKAAQRIESDVVERINQIYLDLTLERKSEVELHTRDAFEGERSSIIDIQNLLKREVIQHKDLVHAIHLFYPKSGVMISSLYGLQYEAGAKEDTSLHKMDWIDAMRTSKQTFLWTAPRLVPKDIYASVSGSNAMLPLMTYARSYPFNAPGKDSDILIGIDMKEAALSAIIGQMMPSDYPNTYLIDASGVVIAAADKTLLGNRPPQAPYIDDLLASDAEAQSFGTDIGRTGYVVSGNKLDANGWSLYNVIPERHFYQKSILLQQIMLAICGLAVVVGLVLSGIFTAVSYQPIKRLVGRIKGLFDHPAEAKHNEFKLIDTAIHQLSSKVNSLEETLQANKPVIKHNVVLNMLHDRYGADELDEQLALLDLPLAFAGYCCLVIDPVNPSFKALGPKTSQYVIYKLINQLEAAVLEDACLIAEELPDRRIAVIVGTNRADDAMLDAISDLVLTEVRMEFSLDVRIAYGLWVQGRADVHRSFDAAQTLIQYGFFYPESPIVREFRLLNREQSQLELAPSVLPKWTEKLHARSLEGVTAATDQLLRDLKEGPYAAEYGRFVLMKLISIYSDFLKNVRFKQSGQFKIDLYKQYQDIADIDGFRTWLVQSIAECFELMEKRSDERATDSVEAVKAYVGAHLADDLSLDAVAAHVYLSPKYLSKMFKEETGVGYTDYVTRKRMERALELVRTSQLTVEQIAGDVGYGTPAYFIKKFKETYGATPKNYVRTLLKQEEPIDVPGEVMRL
ncbi:helix-turn-helix domain-containing protein [Paenibacillus methanolicus]|uniref:Helix-turn-helix protein n=1 Tax=Paenibacillus methanolicus TaxID=582686 RepID=A0A5S5C5R8_9BACL|nr:helix-turn-helix domain-containing protein [Paenibacillus methanolicus]TYP73303.1 helix-turn-helix protein [Paenibacillus methanolicus]